MNPTAKSFLLFGVSAFLGALIWPLSPLFTGHREPWDADSSYYWSALALAGFVPACFSADRVLQCAVGAGIGQVAYFLFLVMSEPGAFWLAGLLFLLPYSLVSLAGAALGAGVHLLFRRLYPHAR